MRVLKLLALLLLVSGCVTGGAIDKVCGPNDYVIRYTNEQIEQMTDEQVRSNLARNEELERRGCAVPNS